jgi:hypothetical protein
MIRRRDDQARPSEPRICDMARNPLSIKLVEKSTVNDNARI